MKNIFYNYLYLSIALLPLSLNGAVPNQAIRLFPIQWSGTREIRASEYTAALDSIRNDTTDRDTAFHFFKLGVIHANLGDLTTALPYFKLAAQKSAIIAPIAYSLMGDIALKRSDSKNANAAYLEALAPDCPTEYHQYIYTKLEKVLKIDTIDIMYNDRFKGYQQWFENTQVKKPSFVIRYIDSLIAIKSWSSLDSLMDTITLKDSMMCKTVSAMSGNTSLLSAFRPNSLLTCANIAVSCKNYTIANIFIDMIEKDTSSSKSIIAMATYLQAQIAYNTDHLDEAIRRFKKYISEYGADSEAMINIARSYRKKDNPSEASRWYTKHVTAFPLSSKTQEILWLQAWQMEDSKKYSKAGEIYKKIYTKFKSGNRRDESYLRHALCYYRQEKYDSSLIILSTFLKKYPTSSLVPSAYFWKGKSFLGKENTPQALATFNQVIDYDLFDYYSHRSLYFLTLLGDTTIKTIDTVIDFKYGYQWINSITSSNQHKVFTHTDSINYMRGIVCASLGLIDIAEKFLKNIEQNSTYDLALQYELALLYSICGAPEKAYRISRRFAWRIPQQYRKSTPLAIYMLIYPAFFSSIIHDESNRNNIDPNLVSAVIRQESIFDPVIVSPAGAIGLMQIMPYTGKDLAKDLKTSFDIDSLYNPIYNIKLGTYYIRDLLSTFDDNIVMVLSSYNAGPHNAKKWYNQNRKEEFDLFIEDIGFTETRGYVKKVLGNYWTYQKLSQYPAFFDNYRSGAQKN